RALAEALGRASEHARHRAELEIASFALFLAHLTSPMRAPGRIRGARRRARVEHVLRSEAKRVSADGEGGREIRDDVVASRPGVPETPRDRDGNDDEKSDA